PDLVFIRPADANETVWAWRLAIENRHRPTVLALTRQNLPTLDRTYYAPAEGLRRGAYVLNPKLDAPQIALIAPRSEVQHIVAADGPLAGKGVEARLVSMPSWELFAEQSEDYRESVLPAALTRRLSVEAGVTLGWHQWVGDHGESIGIDGFGASAPGATLMK